MKKGPEGPFFSRSERLSAAGFVPLAVALAVAVALGGRDTGTGRGTGAAHDARRATAVPASGSGGDARRGTRAGRGDHPLAEDVPVAARRRAARGGDAFRLRCT